MKKRSFLLAGLAALFMASCSDNDLPQGNEQQVIERGYQGYLKVSIANPASGNSRAINSGTDEYEDGIDDKDGFQENKIDEILFVFYNNIGQYVAHSRMRNENYDTGNADDYDGTWKDTDKSDSNSASIESVIKLIVPVGVNANNYEPTHVMAYINPTQKGMNENKTNKLSEISNVKRNYCFSTKTVSNNGNAEEEVPKENKDKRFLMSNSVYFDKDSKMVMATDIHGKLKKTEEEADKETAIEIYVERLAAKVQVLKDADFEKNVSTPVAEKTLKFDIKGWKLNATAKQGYLVKGFGGKTKAQIDEELASFVNSWNDVTNSRSYWADGVNYANGVYPKITTDVLDDRKKGNDANLSLHYYNYNEVIAGGQTWNGVEYCLEHTVDNKTLTSPEEKAALTSVIIVGEYHVMDGDNPMKKKDKDGNDTEEYVDFYRYGKVGGNGTDKDNWKIFLEDDILQELAKDQYILYIKNSDYVEDDENSKTHILFRENTNNIKLSGVFEMARPENIIANANRVVPGRYRFLQLKDKENIEKDKFFVLKEGEFVDITATDVDMDELNTNLFESTHSAEFYNGGKAYFSVPIEQFGMTNGTIAVGTYGIVRNHSYKITVDGINGMGTGIGDPENPIVPPTETLEYYVSAKINVLAWRVASQKVTLGE